MTKHAQHSLSEDSADSTSPTGASGPVDSGTPVDYTAKLAELTLEEKASLASGQDFWHTQGIERVGIPPIMVTDGPHGLRKQMGETDHLGLNQSVAATCFPPAVALASTFDPDLASRMGEALGEEAAVEDVSVILGPGINVKRSPLCGRNFEYFSEDPLLAGEIGAGLVRGIQSKGVGTSVKHFAANNQETDRMRVSSDIDPRTLHEIYLRGFEKLVKLAHPWTVMCSYNKINGVYASEDHWLLTHMLREEWGYDGMVVSDWGAVDNRVAALAAGLDLEMPGGGPSDGEIVEAVRAGALDEAALDAAARRVLALVSKAQERPAATGSLDIRGHHAVAREVAERSVVLLKNDDGALPLRPGQSIALIGEFARTPRFQGGGSSHITPTLVDSALEAMTDKLGDQVKFAAGFTFDGSNAEELRNEAVELAKRQQVAVLFLGLPESAESEGFDRHHMGLPNVQLELVDAVRKANPNTVVVLSNGSAVTLPFADDVKAIVEGWLLGQAGGTAIANVLTGSINPSGRLAETIPLRVEDTPSFLNFPGSLGHVNYGEGIFVGYRGYDASGLEVAYPFGHGLSYTRFAYGQPEASFTDDGNVTITVDITNTGGFKGREVVQVYASLSASQVERAPRELVAYASVELAAGQTRTVTLTVHREDLAYWDRRVEDFVVEGGAYRFDVGASSRDLRGSVVVGIEADSIRIPLTLNSTVAEVLANPVVGPMVQQQLAGMAGSMEGAEDSQVVDPQAMQQMIASIPISRLGGFGAGVTKEQLEQLIAAANAS